MRKRKIHFVKVHCWSETKTNLMSTETPTEKKAEISVSNRQNIGHSRKNCLNLDSRSCLKVWDWKYEVLILVSEHETGRKNSCLDIRERELFRTLCFQVPGLTNVIIMTLLAQTSGQKACWVPVWPSSIRFQSRWNDDGGVFSRFSRKGYGLGAGDVFKGGFSVKRYETELERSDVLSASSGQVLWRL